ncbi:protein trapped in endoderm-1-like [Paramacrobiotus metropolitanus]|uniref:protein trapped in endoderm-1-like n=1 Tax=Paramacrobiotus metropolitanus TaxID=2943436 RepID=UPI0024458ACE|nr:protein trapped in endoderm-1-like [Paramacrobiotus metropolitanus]
MPCTMHTRNSTAIFSDAEWDARYNERLRIGSAVFLIIVGCMSVVGNAVTFAALINYRRLRNPTTVFVINLAVSDFLFALITTPLTAVWCLSDDRLWIWRHVGCRFYVYSGHVLASVSLCSMAAIAVTRLIIIIKKRPTTSKLIDWKAIKAGLIFCWLFPAIALSAPLLGLWGDMGVNVNSIGGCTFLPTPAHNSPRKTIYVVGILVPVFSIGMCYGAIFFIVWRTRARIPILAARRPSDTRFMTMVRSRGWSVESVEDVEPTDEGCFPRRLNSVRNFARVVFGVEWHLTQMMGVTYVTLLVCYIPIVCYEIVHPNNCDASLNVVVTVLVWVSGSLNPIIYTIMSRQFRKAYASLLEKVIHRINHCVRVI